jgi:hypothetical protein
VSELFEFAPPFLMRQDMKKQNLWQSWLQNWQLDGLDDIDPEILRVFVLGAAFGLTLSMVIDILL